MLISNYQKRVQTRISNHQKILKFLRDETWSDANNLQAYMHLSTSGIYKILSGLDKQKLIASVYVDELGKRIFGITPKGLLFAWDDEIMGSRPYFQPKRVKPLMMYHHLDLQRARLNAERAGWLNWLPGTLLIKAIEKRPDALVVSSEGRSIAVELERTVKTKKRYEAIFSAYLQAIKRSEYDLVHYVCPDQSFAKRLLRLFNTIEALPVARTRVPITSRHRAKFPVYSLENWPPSEQKGLFESNAE